jgi:peptidoglycan hydrolase-like protein with peptidoglycan-binding domain
VFAVLNSLVQHTWKDRLQDLSPKVVVEVGSQRTRLYRTLIWQIQERLASHGFYRKTITSTYGPAVVAAMKAYQKSIRFKPTGFPDQATLWRLFDQPQR